MSFSTLLIQAGILEVQSAETLDGKVEGALDATAGVTFTGLKAMSAARPVRVGPKVIRSNAPEGFSKGTVSDVNVLKFEPSRPELPKFDGVTTEGVLYTNEGKIVSLRSGDTNPQYGNYIPAGHAEGKGAIFIRETGSSGGTLWHNNTNGTCGWCDRMIETLLPEKAHLNVVPPEDAIPNNSRAIADPKLYIGNSSDPKPNPR